jgi:hypothetical protein
MNKKTLFAGILAIGSLFSGVESQIINFENAKAPALMT